MIDASKSRSKVLWAKVFGLAALQGAISLAWLIYRLYIPKLLGQFGFEESFANGLLVAESILAIALEPLMGGLSDRSRLWATNRFPFITLGVLLSSGLFIAIPTIVIFGDPSVGLRWILPGVMVLWALAMTVFRSPALALLGGYAFETKLPHAASVLMLMGALAGATGTFARDFILKLGPAMTFAIGSFVLLAAAAALRVVDPQAESGLSSSTASPLSAKISLPNLGLVFATGTTLTLGTILMFTMLGKAPAQFNLGLVAVFSIAHLLTVVPAGALAVRMGNLEAMLLGVGAIATSLAIMTFIHTTPVALGFAFLLGVSFSPVINGTIPLALSLVPPQSAGLGTGFYFGGAALAGTIFGVVMAKAGAIAPSVFGGAGAIFFVISGLCISAVRKRQES